MKLWKKYVNLGGVKIKTQEIMKVYEEIKFKVQTLEDELQLFNQFDNLIIPLNCSICEIQKCEPIEDIHEMVIGNKEICQKLLALNKLVISKVENALKILERKLDPVDFEIFTLRYFENLTYEEITCKFGYANPSSIARKIKKFNQIFEEIIQISGNWIFK